ncbi:MAG: hypothetical protein ABI905_01380 [Betaproteobacteria bacterium]
MAARDENRLQNGNGRWAIQMSFIRQGKPLTHHIDLFDQCRKPARHFAAIVYACA